MRKRIFQVLLILGLIYFFIYLIPTTAYWINDCGMLRFTDFDHFDSECSVGLWAIVYLIYGIPAWVLLILAAIFYFRWKSLGDVDKETVEKKANNRGFKILGIVASLIVVFPFFFERIVNHLFFNAGNALLRGLYPFLISFGVFGLLFVYAYHFFYNLLIYLFLFFPLYYFPWKKEPNNKYIKIWAKISTITIPVYITLRIMDNFSRSGFVSSGWSVWFAISFVIALGFLLSPLYYYAWRSMPEV